MPAQLTTYSASMSPYGVRTPVTVAAPVSPDRVRKPVTGTPSATVTPPILAPFARLIVTSTGLARPSCAT
jgi:hypothetical protein